MKIKDKILIVEDEQSISNFISMVLNANGYDTIIVGSGEEALTMIASHCPDLIVLDLGLPDMDGMEVLKSVRKWSNLPVVVVSARNHEHDKVDALDYGADDYLDLRAAGPYPHRHPPYPHHPGQFPDRPVRQIHRRGPDHRL